MLKFKLNYWCVRNALYTVNKLANDWLVALTNIYRH